MLWKLLIAVVIALVAALQAARFRQRMREPIATDRCIACDSSNLNYVAAGAYECLACGYEGGAGMRAVVEARAAAVHAGLDPEERQRLGRKSLYDALRTLMAVQERSTGDAEEAQRWMASVEETALRAAGELEEAKRASGGTVDLDGHGEFGPGQVAEMLRGSTSSGDNPFAQKSGRNVQRTMKAITTARDQLAQALRNVPEPHAEPKPSAGGYRG